MMKTYICTKVIQAVPVKMVNGCIWPEGLPLPKVEEKKKPELHEGCCHNIREDFRIDDGYLFITEDCSRYTQFMEAAEFERTCRIAENMTFGDALEAVKQGQKIARAGWNGKNMYVFLAFEADFVTDADISAFDGVEVEVGDMFVMKTAGDTFQPGWLASQADMLADDWFVVE